MISSGIAGVSGKILYPRLKYSGGRSARHNNQSKFFCVIAASLVQGEKSKPKSLKGLPPPNCSEHPSSIDSGMEEEGWLVHNNEKEHDYSVMMNCIVPEENTNKYYLMQLIKLSECEYTVYTRWGRIGASGSCQLHKYSIQQDAEKCFENVLNKKRKKGYNLVTPLDI